MLKEYYEITLEHIIVLMVSGNTRCLTFFYLFTHADDPDEMRIGPGPG